MTNPTKEQAYLHVGNAMFLLAYLVDVIKRCPKTAVVRFRHQTTIGKTKYKRGEEKRVPLHALSAKPREGAIVSVGRGRHAFR